MVTKAMEKRIPRRHRVRGRSFESEKVVRDTPTEKAPFEQRPERWKRGSHGDPRGRQFHTE